MNERGPRSAVGLSACGRQFFLSCRLDAGDFHFDAAVFGVIVFANAVGEVNQGTFGKTENRGAGGEVPADGADGGT